MVITTDNWYNRTIGFQPSYFQLQNGRPVSAENLTIPANVPVELMIICYDNGSSYVPPQYLNVTGTQGDVIYIVNNSNVNATPGEKTYGYNQDGRTVSSVQQGYAAHTFTVMENGNVMVNIPVEPMTTTYAIFTLQPGLYSRQCEATCGAGPGGAEGAMQTPGCMSGSITAE